MEVLLHHTQGQMDRARMIAGERGLELVALHGDLHESIFSCCHLNSTKKKLDMKNKDLMTRLCELQDQLASLEHHVAELEDKTAKLLKENDILLS
jgi:predicted nuclease with TOPRIM domain